MIPTKITGPMFKERYGKIQAKLYVPTDVGVMAFSHLRKILGISTETLRQRLMKNWQDPRNLDVEPLNGKQWFDPKETEYDPADDEYLIKQGRRDPLTVRLGAWERRTQRFSLTAEQAKEKRLAQKRRDEEYQDYLRHHRAICR